MDFAISSSLTMTPVICWTMEKEGIRDIVQTFGAQNKADIFRDIFAELKCIMCANVGNTDYVMKAFNTFSKATQSYNLSPAMVRRNCFEIASALYFSYLGDSRGGGIGKTGFPLKKPHLR